MVTNPKSLLYAAANNQQTIVVNPGVIECCGGHSLLIGD